MNNVLRDQPGYRIAYDAHSLTTRELLSLVIGGKNSEEVARSLLERFHGIRQLYQADIEEICCVLGVGRKTAEKITAALHLGLPSTIQLRRMCLSTALMMQRTWCDMR